MYDTWWGTLRVVADWTFRLVGGAAELSAERLRLGLPTGMFETQAEEKAEVKTRW